MLRDETIHSSLRSTGLGGASIVGAICVLAYLLACGLAVAGA